MSHTITITPRHVSFYERAREGARIHASELVGPNSYEFEALEEKLLDKLLAPVCGECPHMECNRCTN